MQQHDPIRRLAVLGAVLLVAALAPAGAGAAPRAAPTLEQIGNARSAAHEGDQPVQLEHGRWEGAPYVEGGAARPTLLLLEAADLTADLDARPGDERAVLFSAGSGGSGERLYLSVYGWQDDDPRELASVLLGDRVKIRALGAAGDTLWLELVVAGAQDPACCPTRLVRRSYHLREGRLMLASEEAQGTLSLALLGGVDWVLVQRDGHALPDGAQPPTLRVDGNTLTGFGGCNRYRASAAEPSGGRLDVHADAVIATRMACAEPQGTLESEYLAALGAVDSFSFVLGRLALSWRSGEQGGVLLFEPR